MKRILKHCINTIILSCLIVFNLPVLSAFANDDTNICANTYTQNAESDEMAMPYVIHKNRLILTTSYKTAYSGSFSHYEYGAEIKVINDITNPGTVEVAITDKRGAIMKSKVLSLGESVNFGYVCDDYKIMARTITECEGLYFRINIDEKVTTR